MVIENEPIATEAGLSQKLTGDSRQPYSGGRFVAEGSTHNEPREMPGEARGEEQGKWREKQAGRYSDVGTGSCSACKPTGALRHP